MWHISIKSKTYHLHTPPIDFVIYKTGYLGWRNGLVDKTTNCLLGQRTRVQFSSPTWHKAADNINFSSKGSTANLWPSWALHVCGIRIYMLAKHSHTQNKYVFKKTDDDNFPSLKDYIEKMHITHFTVVSKRVGILASFVTVRL